MVETEAEQSAGGNEPDRGSFSLMWRVIAVALLVAAATGVLWLRSAADERGGSGPPEQGTAASVTPFTPAPQREERPGRIVATVNGEAITTGDLEAVLAELPEARRELLSRDRVELLEQIIVDTVLLQEARRQGLRPAEGQPESTVIRELLRRQLPPEKEFSQEDLHRFYEENKDALPEQVRPETHQDLLRVRARAARRNSAVNGFVEGLLAKAAVERDEEWIAGQKAAAADNPLDRALGNGKPVLVDFGRDLCVPCKMMKPILEDLEEEYRGRAEVLLLNVHEYPVVARRVGVRSVPTQVFYDAEGREVGRHVGFMPREDIVAKLSEMGVQ
ncbi:MAG: thioredoxin domain-containing protein [Candidatus Brocadiia bacterium]